MHIENRISYLINLMLCGLSFVLKQISELTNKIDTKYIRQIPVDLNLSVQNFAQNLFFVKILKRAKVCESVTTMRRASAESSKPYRSDVQIFDLLSSHNAR